jgi:uncharacterized membrane protein
MKKLIPLAIALAFILTTFTSVYADAMTPKSVNTIMSEIRLEQGVKSNDKINQNKVGASKLEALGDSVMQAMIDNTAIHDQMDVKLGGDGSASLTAMHTKIGYNYLVGYPNGMMTLMSAGMMGTNGTANASSGSSGMMGTNGVANASYGSGGMMGYLGWGGMIMGIIVLILFMIILFFVFKSLSKNPIGSSLDTPLDILGNRYANGYLTQEEYERMIGHLKN